MVLAGRGALCGRGSDLRSRSPHGPAPGATHRRPVDGGRTCSSRSPHGPGARCDNQLLPARSLKMTPSRSPHGPAPGATSRTPCPTVQGRPVPVSARPGARCDAHPTAVAGSRSRPRPGLRTARRPVRLLRDGHGSPTGLSRSPHGPAPGATQGRRDRSRRSGSRPGLRTARRPVRPDHHGAGRGSRVRPGLRTARRPVRLSGAAARSMATNCPGLRTARRPVRPRSNSTSSRWSTRPGLRTARRPVRRDDDVRLGLADRRSRSPHGPAPGATSPPGPVQVADRRVPVSARPGARCDGGRVSACPLDCSGLRCERSGFHRSPSRSKTAGATRLRAVPGWCAVAP